MRLKQTALERGEEKERLENCKNVGNVGKVSAELNLLAGVLNPREHWLRGIKQEKKCVGKIITAKQLPARFAGIKMPRLPAK